MNAQEFVEDVLRRWGEHREHEDERARFWAEREVALAIYTQMQGTENMVCPAEWRTCLVAGDELRAKFAAIPDEVIAYQGISSGVLEGYGVTDELVEKTLGPGEALVDALPPATRCWLYQEILSEVFYGERSYRIATLLRQDPERARAVLENLEAHRAQAD